MKWIHHLLVPTSCLLVAAQIHVCEGRNSFRQPSLSFTKKFGRHLQEKAGVVAGEDGDIDDAPNVLSTQTQAVLSGVRGGFAVNVSRQLVAATAGASILALYGLGCMLDPKKVCEDAYDISLDDEPPVISHIVRNSGILTSTGNYAIWALAYSLTSRNKAIGVAVIPYALRSIYNLVVTKSPAKFGLSAPVQYISLLLSSFTAYATLSNAPFADAAIQALGAGMILYGLYLFVFPQNMVAGRDKDVYDFVTVNARNYGNNLIINGVFFAAIGMGFDIFKSFGYCWWYAAAGMGALNFVTKDIPKFGGPTAAKATTIWVLLCAILGTIMAT